MATREYVIGGVIGAALVGGLVVWHPFPKPTPVDGKITFSEYNFYDNKSAENGVIVINGSLHIPTIPETSGDQPANNTYTINCVQSEMICHVASAEQIGDHQVDEITLSDFTVKEWQPSEIIATDFSEGDTLSCAKNTISIDRASQKTYYITEPVNVERPSCARADTKTIKYTIEDSRVWRYLKAATKIN